MNNKIISSILTVFMIVSVLFSIAYAQDVAPESHNVKTYLNSNGKIGIYPFFYPGSETADWKPLPGESEPRIHLKREYGDTSDRTPYFEFDVHNIDKDILSYVYEIDVYPAKFTGYNGHKVSVFNVYNSTDNKLNDTPLLINNNILQYQNTTIATIPLSKWSRLSCVVDLSSNTFDAYVNGELKASDILLTEKIIPKRVRVALNWGNRETEFYFDNIKLYEGDSLRNELDTFVSNKETGEDVDKLIGSSSVFMINTDDIYINGQKTTYTANNYSKYENNGVLYVSPNAFKDAVKCTDSDIQDFLTDFNAITYVPLENTAKKLGKYVYSDDRGWICISDSDLDFSNYSVSSKADEDSDIIDRFMQFSRPSGDEIYSLLRQNMNGIHPRIFITSDDLAVLKNDMLTDSFKYSGAKEVIRQADEILNKGTVAYEKEDGLRLFLPCLNVRNYLITLTTAYMITDDMNKKQAYFDRIWLELDNVCNNWKDWNVERHYLDVGKLSVGIALAYDVCYNELGKEKRAIIRDAVLNKFLYYACASYAGDTNNYNIGKSTVNWGAVCNGGALLLCLATLDDPDADKEYTDLCKFVAEEALYGLEYPVSCTFPNGAWDEGLSYYGYVTEYLSWSANALRNCCGSDFGIMSYPGVSQLPDYALYIQSLSNGFFNYSDGASDTAGCYVPSELFLIAKHTDNRELNDMLYNLKFNIMKETIHTSQFVRDFLFYTPGDYNDEYNNYPLDKKFGNTEISVMKGGWDSDDTYFASIGGITDANSHYDKGSFIFDLLGERWAIDLGKDDYNIEGGYYGELGNTIYRKRAEGHNTLVFNPDEGPGQKSSSLARITDFESGVKESYTIYDLSDVYSDDCTKASRGFFLGDNRNSLLIQDEFTLRNPTNEVYWFMHTRADIEVADDDTVTLTQNGKSVNIDFLSNLEAFSVYTMKAEGLPSTPERPGQASNEGITKVCFKGSGSGDAYIVAKITPVDEDLACSDISYTPMSEWENDDSPADNTPKDPVNVHTIDFENYNEAVYLNKSSSVTYPDNYYNRTQADTDLLPITDICQDMFTNGTLSIEESNDSAHGKVLTMKRLGGTLYQNHGYFMIPANIESDNVVAKTCGKLNLSFDIKYMHNWKFAMYISPVSENKSSGTSYAIIAENSYIAPDYIGDFVNERWIPVKLTYDLDKGTYYGSVGKYLIKETPFELDSPELGLSYYKIDVTMSGEGRYASFDNFTTSYIPSFSIDELTQNATLSVRGINYPGRVITINSDFEDLTLKSAALYFDDVLIADSFGNDKNVRYCIPQNTKPGDYDITLRLNYDGVGEVVKSIPVSISLPTDPIYKTVTDFENCSAKVYETYETSAEIDCIDFVNSNMFNYGNVEITTTDSHGKMLRLNKTKGSTLYAGNGSFYFPSLIQDNEKQKVSDGKLLVEFDFAFGMTPNWATVLQICPFSQNGHNQFAVTLVHNMGVIPGTDKSISDTDFHHAKICFDIDTGEYTASIDDIILPEGSIVFPQSDGEKNIYQYRIGAAMSRTGDFLSVDNIKTSYIPRSVYKNAEYIKGTDAHSAVRLIAFDADEIKINVNKDYSPTLSSDVRLYINDEEKTVNAYYNSNAIAIPLDAVDLKEGDKIRIYVSYDALLSDGSYCDEEIALSLFVGNTDGNLLDISDNTAKAIFEIDSSDFTDIKSFIAVYKGDKLLDVKVKSMSVSSVPFAGESEEILLPQDYDSVRCFVFDLSHRPITKPISK